MMLDTVNIWQLTHTHEHTHTHTNRTASWQTSVCSECTLIWKQPQLSATTAGSVLCAQLGGMTCELFGLLLVTDDGLANGTSGHVSVLEVDMGRGGGVWGRLAGSFVRFFIFFWSQKIIKRYMHKRVNVIGLAATRSRCKPVCPHHDGWWSAYVNKNSIWRLKKSILFVLPDILMFNMRVLYYHDDYDYSCAILVYCCLNVTLFFYDMRWKTLGLRMMAIL